MTVSIDKQAAIRKWLTFALTPQCISLGHIDGITPLRIIGANPDVDFGSTPETLWPQGGIYIWPTSGNQLSIVSDSTADDLVGTGGRSLKITGLDSTWTEVVEVVDLDGTTPVTTIGTDFFRVNDIRLTDAGSLQTNAGTIAVTGGGFDYSCIAPGDSLSRQLIYTVPLGFTLVGSSFQAAMNFGVAPASSMDLDLFVRVNGGTVFYHVAQWSLRSDGVSFLRDWADTPVIFLEKTDIEMRATAASTNNVSTSGRIEAILIDNDIISPV